MHFLSVPKEDNRTLESDKEIEIKRLMDLYGTDVLRIAALYLKNRQNAEDAFQEVFIKVYNKLESFDKKSSEKTWLISITINVCRDMLRTSWFRRVTVTDKFNEKRSEDIEKKIIRKDDNKALMEAVTSLPQIFREVIILYYYQEYDTAEISKIVNAAEGTVRSRLHRARDMLKQKLGGRLDLGE